MINVNRVVFDSSFKAVKPTSMHGWFSFCSGLSILDIRGLDTSKVTDMSNLFLDCEWLENIKLTGLSTSSVTNMDCMFEGCKNLNTIICSDSTTEWKISGYDMFKDCYNLIGRDGDVKVPYDERITGGLMARAANLGGYFTPKNSTSLYFGKTSRGDSYVLQCSTNKDMTGAKTKVVLGANNTSYTIGGLKKGKTYYISIRVRKKVNGISYYTTFGVARAVKVTK